MATGPVGSGDWPFVPLFNWKNKYMLNVKLTKSRGSWLYRLSAEPREELIEVDIVLGFDLSAHFSSKEDTFNFLCENEGCSNEFSPSMAEAQRDFMVEQLNVNQNQNLKKLMLLVKYWLKTEVKRDYPDLKIPSYLVELICLHVWEERLAGGRYDLARWFEEVMTTLVQYSSLNCDWGKGLDCVPSKLEPPVVMDPANPFNNVAGLREKDAWPQLADCARKQLNKKSKYSGTSI